MSQTPDPEHTKLMQTIDDINTGKRVLREPEYAGELRDKELETVMERACNNLSNGAYAALDNKLVNWPSLFSEVRSFIIAEQTKLLEKLESELPSYEIPAGGKDTFEETSPFDSYGTGCNDTLSQVRTLIAKHKEGLKQ